MPNKLVVVKDISISNALPFVLIAGPCLLESSDHAHFMMSKLLEIVKKFSIPFIYKTSFDKANRSAVNSKRGLGLKEALNVFIDLKDKYKVPIITDVHSEEQCPILAEVIDVIQIPAFLSRQTDLLFAAGKTNKPINVKKGQFLAPWDMKNVIAKIESVGNKNIMLCERGSTFGYNNLIVDMTSLPIMSQTGYPVIFDATHSVQKPGGLGDKTGGNREYASVLAKAAIAIGVSGLFLEVHQDPDNAPSDGLNMIKLDELPAILSILQKIDNIAKN